MAITINHHPGEAPGVEPLLPGDPRSWVIIVATLLAAPWLALLLTCGLTVLDQALVEPPAEYELELRAVGQALDVDAATPKAYMRLRRLSTLELTLRPTSLSAVRPAVRASLIHNGQQQVLPLPRLTEASASWVLRATVAKLPELPDGVSTLVIELQSPSRLSSAVARLGPLWTRFLPVAPTRNQMIYGILEMVP